MEDSPYTPLLPRVLRHASTPSGTVCPSGTVARPIHPVVRPVHPVARPAPATHKTSRVAPNQPRCPASPVVRPVPLLTRPVPLSDQSRCPTSPVVRPVPLSDQSRCSHDQPRCPTSLVFAALCGARGNLCAVCNNHCGVGDHNCDHSDKIRHPSHRNCHLVTETVTEYAGILATSLMPLQQPRQSADDCPQSSLHKG